MSDNLGLFITHHLFLTDEQIEDVVSGRGASCVGHCVPVWMDAKTGRTTEPAREVFCSYKVFNSTDKINAVESTGRRGYSIWLPRSDGWSPPEAIDFGALAGMDKDQRARFLEDRDRWWFNNPRPMDADDLSRGYLRFEIKIRDLKVGRRKYSAQHIVEMSSMDRLLESFV